MAFRPKYRNLSYDITYTMTPRRPTLNVGEWKIAVDLEKTKQLQSAVKSPAYHCQCCACQRWKKRVIATSRLLSI